jgi:NAD-dependent deacetylase
MQVDLDAAATVLRPALKILVFSGAGISTESGIPDFRGPEGLWTRMDPEDFTIERYKEDAEIRKRSWQMHAHGFFGGMLAAEPNRAHEAIVRLWEHGRMAGCVTQNIDGLHQAAGLPDEAVAELHGNLRRAVCTGCAASWPIETVLTRVAAGETDPACLECGAIVKTSTVLFGELLPEQAFGRAIQMISLAEAVLAIGSTLSVFPAADLVLGAVRDGIPLVIVNQGSTAFDSLAAARIDQPAGSSLPGLIDVVVSTDDE